MRGDELALWACPIGAERERLATLVGELARSLATPPFEPHVTLLSGRADDAAADEIWAVAGTIWQPTRLAVRAVGHSAAFLRAVVLELVEEPGVCRLRDRLLQIWPSASAEWRPHLSLAYGDLAGPVREDWSGRLGGRIDSVGLATLRLVRPGGDAGWMDVGSWRVVRSTTGGGE